MILAFLRRLVLPVVVAVAMLPGAGYAQKAFERKDLASSVVRFDTTLRDSSEQSDLTRPTAQLRKDLAAAKARNDMTRAYELASAILVREPGNFQDWLTYARLVSSFDTDDYEERTTWRDYAQTAAYAAYQLATKPADKAAALVVLAEAQTRGELFRPAIDSYKASLALHDNAKTRAVYEDLRARYGFRILSNNVDSDAASPRACFQFSERVANGIDFAPYVAVAGSANAAVTADDMQVCVDGLKHGERYAIVVRQGLPSADGDALLRNADYEIYVRDRAPSVRFTGRNYVLPSTGQEGLPLVSVNTNSAEIDIFRVGDRNLLPTIRDGGFLDQLNRWVIDTLKEERGEKIWSGTLKTQSPLNKDEVTAFPLNEAIGKTLAPGVYVMTARPEGGAPADEDYGQRATQWFVVSDIGLTALSNEGGLRLLARSLASAQPLANIDLRLIARNNEELATARTNAQGEVSFDPGLSRGQGGLRPGLVIATTPAGDYNFLDLEQAPFDLTDRGVAGRKAPGPLDGQVFTERGVYRTGESVFVTTLLRDGAGNATNGLPLTMIARRPDGVEYKRAVVNDQGLGGRVWSLPLLAGAAHGTWRVQAYVDPKGDPIGEATFLVEDYVPERIEVKLTPEAKILTLGDVASIDVNAKFLYGAPAAGLNVTGEIAVVQAEQTAIPGLAGFRTGIDDELFNSVSLELADGAVTDAQGNARVTVPLPEVSTMRPIEARIALRVAESGGRAVERSVTLPIIPSQPVIGVKPLFTALTDGAQAGFEVVSVTPQGVRQAGKVRWILSRIEENYQWYNREGNWSFETVSSTRRVQDGTLDLTSEGDPARISMPVEWGKYRLEVSAVAGAAQPVSFTFSSGFSGQGSANTPDKLDLVLDKAAYSAGDTMTVTLKPRFSGKVTVVIASDKLYEERIVDITPEGTSVTLPVKAEWGPGAYVMALAHRPLDVAARRQPGRALGLAWFSVDRAARTLAVELSAPQTMKPRGQLSVPVKIGGLQPGEEAYVALAAVDVGILNLTRYEPPRPDDFFFGQRQLGTDVRDLYGFLIDGMQGTRGAIRSGGDGGALRLEGSPPSQAPLALFSGVVKVGADGTATVDFDIPSFNGTVKVFAVAWSKDRVGQASTDVIVRDPVVISASMPRFMNVGDGSLLFLAVDNVAGEAGDYHVTVKVDGPLQVDTRALSSAVRLEKGAQTGFALPLTGTGVGHATIAYTITGPGVDAEQTLQLGIGAGTRPLTRRTVQALLPGAGVSLGGDLLKDFQSGTGVAALSVAPVAALDVPALLGALDRFPYGCTEQTVSRALPLIYANALAALKALPADANADTRVNEAIARVLSRQGPLGSFGLWSAGGDDLWLDAFVADFLTRAREHNYDVPQLAFMQTLDRLRNAVVNSADFPDGEGEGLAYAAYVLARNGRPVIGDLRYFADVRLASFGTPLAQAQIGAGLALLGDRTRADRVIGEAVTKLSKAKDSDKGRNDFGSVLRDAAGILALVGETGAGRVHIATITQVLEKARNARNFTSTQENTWLVLAATALANEAKNMSLSVDGVAQTGPLFRTLSGVELATRPMNVINTGDTPVQAVIGVAGNPIGTEPPLAHGYEVERSYYRLDGTQVDPATVQQNERLVTVLKVTEREARQAEVLLVDYLPAGFEIDNPRLVDSADVAALSWLTRDVEPSHVEYRDDRFVAAFSREPEQAAFFSVAYVVRAVSPGRFVHPPAVVEDMYRPDRFGRTGYGRVEVTGMTGAP
ncbi:alpha-2-macroglobulin family protein [Pseudochelatococcus sp. G4_1912]|uniref:alpha-2-macroglobulin family protein n=1 Tax=Pseudochelatococcus sp. G4_1912 TaxID=3114288 RepID=UPI0039C60CA5